MTTARNGIHEAIETLNGLDLDNNQEAKEYREKLAVDLAALNGLIAPELLKQNRRFSLFRDHSKVNCYTEIIDSVKAAVILIAHNPDGDDAAAKSQRLIQIKGLATSLKPKNKAPYSIRRLLSSICTGLWKLGKIVLFGLGAGIAGVGIGAIIGSSAGPVGAMAGATIGAIKGTITGVTTGIATGVTTGGILSGITGGAAAVPAALGSTGSLVGLTASLSMASINLSNFFCSPDPIKEKLMEAEESMMKLTRSRGYNV